MSKTTKNSTHVVTEAEYQAELAEGLTEDEVMKPGTYKVRRSPWAEKLKNINKVKVTMYLDEVIVEYFRRARAVLFSVSQPLLHSVKRIRISA